MRIVSSFPNEVVDVEHRFIPMTDGVRLASRLWIPRGAEESPVPAILEYIPYRKGDRMRLPWAKAMAVPSAASRASAAATACASGTSPCTTTSRVTATRRSAST